MSNSGSRGGYDQPPTPPSATHMPASVARDATPAAPAAAPVDASATTRAAAVLADLTRVGRSAAAKIRESAGGVLSGEADSEDPLVMRAAVYQAMYEMRGDLPGLMAEAIEQTRLAVRADEYMEMRGGGLRTPAG